MTAVQQVLLVGGANSNLPVPPTVVATKAITAEPPLNIYYEKNSSVTQQPASFIKLLTNLVMRDWVPDADLDDTVTVTAADAFAGATANLLTNDVISYRDLAYGMMLPSGNDAALCVARNVGNLILTFEGMPLTDPVGRFLTAMAAKATSLSLSGVIADTPHGFDTASRMTAQQSVVIFSECLDDAFLKTVMGTLSRLITITGVNARTYTVTHQINPAGATLLPEFVAGKTGFTTDAGYCVIILWATPDGQDRISAVMNSNSDDQRYVDIGRMIDYEIRRTLYPEGRTPSSSGLHFEGANLSTTFTDVRGKTWTASGDAKISTAWAAFGSSSGLFDGSGDAVTTPDHADFQFGLGSFTVAAFVRFATVPTNTVVVSKWGATTPFNSWALYMDSGSLYFRFYDGSGYRDTGASWTPVANTQYHVAADRDRYGVVRIYVNGVVLASSTFKQSVATGGTADVTIGRVTGYSVYDLNGYVDDLIIDKGSAWFGGAFTVPTAAFSDT
jgi:D-alanyl-D-alanine carboxypeptidase